MQWKLSFCKNLGYFTPLCLWHPKCKASAQKSLKENWLKLSVCNCMMRRINFSNCYCFFWKPVFCLESGWEPCTWNLVKLNSLKHSWKKILWQTPSVVLWVDHRFRFSHQLPLNTLNIKERSYRLVTFQSDEETWPDQKRATFLRGVAHSCGVLTSRSQIKWERSEFMCREVE